MVGIGRFIYNSFYLQHLLYPLISLSYTFNLIKLLRSNALAQDRALSSGEKYDSLMSFFNRTLSVKRYPTYSAIFYHLESFKPSFLYAALRRDIFAQDKDQSPGIAFLFTILTNIGQDIGIKVLTPVVW